MSHIGSHEQRTFAAQYTSQLAKKWMRLKMFQLMHEPLLWHLVDQLIVADQLMLVWAWMLVTVLLKNGNVIISMMWVGFVSSRWNNACIIAYIHCVCMHVNDFNTGHNEVISFDSMWIRRSKDIARQCLRSVYIFDEAFRLILSVAFLYLED